MVSDISEWIVKRAVVALVDEHKLWDVHRPLESDCTVQLLSFDNRDPFHVNKAFWRTCSFLLGAVVSNAFKNDIAVTLHSFPSPNGMYYYIHTIPYYGMVCYFNILSFILVTT